MGMTIDETRRELISGKPYTYKFAMALVVALDTMRKYQKIQEIHKEYANTQYEYIGIQKIGEVLKDGNDDQNN